MNDKHNHRSMNRDRPERLNKEKKVIKVKATQRDRDLAKLILNRAGCPSMVLEEKLADLIATANAKKEQVERKNKEKEPMEPGLKDIPLNGE